MDWLKFEDDLMDKHIHTIDNNRKKNIVLFGSCHVATIGYMLNKLLNYEYNIHIIISWFFENKGIEKFNMNDINNRISNLVSNCDIFIYHIHINDYSVNATVLPSLVNEKCLKLILPNYRLDFTNNDVNNFNQSLQILKYHILSSSFSDFNLVIDNYKDIIFFNTTNHPTHYLLFLQSEYIVNKILKNEQTISIENYYDKKNREYFKEFKYVTLPGKEYIDDKIYKITGIKMDADYFDLST
jgi:hypothetical protein